MNSFKIIFTADIHGNIKQYTKLFNKAKQLKINAVIIGGDITPKDGKNRTIANQRKFLKQRLFPMIKKFHQTTSCKTYLIMGNDDFRANESILIKNSNTIGFEYIHNKSISIHKNFRIAGYSFVPLTPFIYKDWEKLDANTIEEKKYRKDVLWKGIQTTRGKIERKIITAKIRKDTIENDLRRILKENVRNTILISHAPPYATSLDNIKNDHVGSIALKKIIKEKQPRAVLSGHIHENILLSGKFKEDIIKTTCINVSNDYLSEKLAIIIFEIYKIRAAKRKLI